MLRNRLLFLLLLVGALGCDNVGRAFDRNVNPDDPDTETGTSSVQVVPTGGTTAEGRPRVRAVYPEGAGWPGTVPIVVEFSESINEASLLPTTPSGLDGRIGVRISGTQAILPVQYDLLANGRLLVMRPLQPLTDNGGAIYEIVLFPEARDVDGVRFQVSDGEEILGDFQVNQAESITDGRIVAIYPRDNNREHQRDGSVLVVFDRPANDSSVDTSTMFVAPANGTAVAASVTTVLNTVLSPIDVADTRIYEINPNGSLASATDHEVTVSENITFGQDGNLDFNGAVPFSVFTTVGPLPPTMVELASPVTGFPNKINQTNVGTAMLSVTPPADSLVGDRVVARIYGSDAFTSQVTFDLDFLEASVELTAAGAVPVTIDFSGQLGTITGPKFDDGDITFVARMERGGDASGFIQNDENADPRFDITPPTLQMAGPPTSDDGMTIYTDQEAMAFYGTASEEVAAASLTVGANPAVALFASASDGRFVTLPVVIGRATTALNYSLTLTDTAGNVQIAPASGLVVQYGLTTGTLAGTLTVHAFDNATLRPIEGATVLVDPMTPMMPASGQLAGVTNAEGRVTFSTASAAHTVTIVRAGYDLVTLYDSQAATISLPLDPITNATAIQRGSAVFAPAPGTTAIVSNTAMVGGSGLGVRTTNAAPNEIPDLTILPNRPQLITGFGGSFEPTASPGYTIEGCSMCGPTLLVPTAPIAPAEPGEAVEASVALIDSMVTLLSSGVHTEDFAMATGLDTANIVTGDPIVRVTASLLGFSHQALMGVGYIDSSTGTSYDVQANFSLPLFGALGGFLATQVGWLALEAEDTAGRISRTRSALIVGTGQVLDDTDPPGIPVIGPGGTFTGSPLVTVDDPLDAADFPGAFGFLELTATDPNGRNWKLMVVDRDGSGGTDAVQFPDLATNGVTGLDVGAWSILAEARVGLTLSAMSLDDVILAERLRSEVNYSRGLPVTFTIQ